jgi:hypothetical protein
MIHRWRSTAYKRASGMGSDTDALQTDVMRFMSILGLCLMAVFALVQSLPLQEDAPVQPDPDRVLLHNQIAAQQQRMQALNAELQRLLSRVEQVNTEKTERERALSNAEQQLGEVMERTEQARGERIQLSRELESLQQRLDYGRYTLATLQHAADDKAQSLRSLQLRLDKEKLRQDEIRQQSHELKLQQATEESRQAMRALQRKLEQDKRRQSALRLEQQRRHQTTIRQQEREADEQQARMTPSPVTEEQSANPPKKGFTLRFASDEALQRQIATGSVSLFAMADKQAWRLSLPHGRPVFTGTEFPGWFHEMAASTVPVEYVRQLQVSVTAKKPGSIVWGVQLPPATKRDIASVTRGREGGDLVIASNGRVSLAAE